MRETRMIGGVVSTIACALIAQFSFAMPSQNDIKRVQPMVLELMAEHVKDHKANKKSAKEVGDAAVELAKDAEGEAAKYLLLKGAIEYYTLAKEYELVADALESLRASVKDFPAEDVTEIASRALNRARRGEAQRLRAICRIVSIQAKAETDARSFRLALRKNPDDQDALNGLADAYVRQGDWANALKVFSKLGVKAATFELNPAEAQNFDSLMAADYWWDFKTKGTELYRAHAVALYKDALNAGLVKGLQKNLVKKRIAEVEVSDSASASSEMQGGHVADVPGANSVQPPRRNLSAEVASSKELVINGTFEADAVSDGSYDTTTAITGWSKDGAVALIRKNTDVSWKQKDSNTTMCFINSGASISQTINVPERMNFLISLKKANKNYYNKGKKFYSTIGCVKIDDLEVISKLETDGGNTRSFSTNVELTAGSHILKISCTSGRGRGMSVDDVTISCVPSPTADSRAASPEQPQVIVPKGPTAPAEPAEGTLEDLQKRLNDNSTEIKELVKKNPACYINPKTSSIINRQNKIATMKDRRYCACANVTFVRDAFYCSNCKRITPYRDDGDYDRYGYCNVCRQMSFHRWLEARKNVEETAKINARLNELYTEKESLEKQIHSIKNSRSRR